jgi:hypothetical protein
MRTLLAATVVAMLSLGLSGCILEPGKPDVSVQLPKPPSYYWQCFHKLTPTPRGELDRAMVVKLVAELRQSEKRKSQCGKDLLAWYDTVSLAYAKKR